MLNFELCFDIRYQCSNEEIIMTANSPWGDGYPRAGHLKGYPSIPKSVYSCSIPNQMQWSLTSSITLLQLARWLDSRQEKVKPEKSRLSWAHWMASETHDLKKVPAAKRLYLRTSQRTSLFGSRVKGSLNMRTGMRYMSLLEPSAW